MKHWFLVLLGLVAVSLLADAAEDQWEVFAPGKAPAGEVVTLAEAAEIKEAKAPYYLIGTFSVTASSKNRAVLRDESALAAAPNERPSFRPMRVVVEYLPEFPVPATGETVVRTEKNPFLIMRVHPMADDQTTVYVREIIRE